MQPTWSPAWRSTPPPWPPTWHASGGVLLAERVVLTVGALTGDQAGARQAVNRAVAEAARPTAGFAEALLRDPLVSSVLSRSQIDELLDPAGYLGASAIWIERALAAHDRESHRDSGR